MKGYEQLKLENQICFPLYATSRLITKLYHPLLNELDLTYPQYLILMVLWENDSILVTEIGKKLLLETNTLTPLLKRLEMKELISRRKSDKDKREVFIDLTQSGVDLQHKAAKVPIDLLNSIGKEFTLKEGVDLKTLLDKLIKVLT